MLAQSAKYLDLVVKGGELSFPLVGDVQILGLRNAQTLIDTSLKGLPAGLARSARRCSRSAGSRGWPPRTST